MTIKRSQDLITPYRGRFAPSPSGYLHFGSLITALASFLDARKNNGTWLVRIEDIDPPREKTGASKIILNTLEAYGLEWDEDILYQSKQSELYQEKLNSLFTNQQSYYCRCTRAEIKAIGGTYLGHCKQAKYSAKNAAMRIINSHPISSYQDLIQGKVICSAKFSNEDFIVFRKDGLFAYQLAVVIDDDYQGITDVIRGCDLLESTVRQQSLFHILGKPTPNYGHIPLAVTTQGYKLSKQNNAPAIDANNPQTSLIKALEFLGQQPPAELSTYSAAEIIEWAIPHWQRDILPKQREISLE